MNDSAKLAEIEQMCCASGDSFSAGEWCEAAGISVEIAHGYQQALEEIAAGAPVTVDGVNYIRPGRDRAIAALEAAE